MDEKTKITDGATPIGNIYHKEHEDGLFSGNSNMISVLEREHFYKLIGAIATEVIKRIENRRLDKHLAEQTDDDLYQGHDDEWQDTGGEG